MWVAWLLYAYINGWCKLSLWDALTFLFSVFSLILFSEIFLFTVPHTFSYVHWFLIELIRIRINLFIQMLSVTFSMHYFSIIILIIRIRRYYFSLTSTYSYGSDITKLHLLQITILFFPDVVLSMMWDCKKLFSHF